MKKPSKKNRFLIILALSIIIILLSIFYFIVWNKPFLYAGTLETTNVDLSARLAASIETVKVYEGDRVQQGQILITLNCEDYKIAQHLAEAQYQRYRKLLEKGWTTPETVDSYKTQKDDADTKVGWCTLSSPIDGKVLSRYHEPGEWMEPGLKILTLANIKDIYAYIYVPQPKVAKLFLGMKLKAYLPELNNRIFEGIIIKINDQAEFTPKNVQTQKERERLIYGVKISFLGANETEILKPGMTVEVELPK